MGKNRFLKAAAAAAVAGMAAAAVKTLGEAAGEANKEVKRNEKKQFADLLKNQFVTEVFTVSDAKEWFMEQAGNDTDAVMYVSYFTEGIARQFHVQDAELLDESHYIFQVIQNNRTKEIISMRLVNFEEIVPKFKSLLDENDGKVLFKR